MINAVKVEFTEGGKKYTYLLPSRLVDNVKSGDYVVVPNAYGSDYMPYKIAKIYSCLINFIPNSTKYKVTYKYIVDKIDTTDYLQEQKEQEQYNEFKKIIDSLYAYCDKWHVYMNSDVKTVYDIADYKTVTSIELEDHNKYRPVYYHEE